ncbi:MAG: hypothetical protein K2L03_03580 [Bacteroidales bacterium]|nr:hypothetical protein [Bacteroidales bacterium]
MRKFFIRSQRRRRWLLWLELIFKTCLIVACIIVGAATVSMGARLSAQELSGIAKRKPFTISGQADAEFSSFLSQPKNFNRPFSYLLNVSLNPAVYGIALPVQLSFGQDGFNFKHPFNTLQITPSYKWIKAYIGRTGMTMSPYGLAGIGFDGAGVELTPDFLPVSLSAMFGRLQKEDVGDSLRPPTYRRLAYGLKVGWTHGQQQLDLHFFQAWDNDKVLAGAETPPQRNYVLSWQGRFLIADLVTLGAEGGLSFLQNRPAAEDPLAGVDADKAIPGLSFKVRAQAFGAELAYERQGAQFYSMGRYYSGGDLESLSLGYSGDIKQKLRFSGRLGWQRDNLSQERQSRMNRLAADVQLQYASDGPWEASASYSNFTTHTRLLPMQVEPGAYTPIAHPDSLRNTQLSQQAQVRVACRLGPQDHVHTLSFDFSFQESRLVGEPAMNDYFTAQLSHQTTLPKDSRLNTAWHAQAVYRPASKQAETYTGPSVNFSKSLLQDKSLSLNGRLQYDLGFGQRKLQSGLVNLGGGVAYRFAKHHQLDLRVNLRVKHTLGADTAPDTPAARTDFTGTLRYAYRF